jgi:serine phosphatase RsbU (regulator of sigma subunit)
MGQRLIYWFFLGVIGFTTFFVLHSSISFNGGAPIEDSRATIEGKTAALANQLGFSTDTLQFRTGRTQHLNYYQVLKDSTDGDLPNVKTLNKRGIHLSGWEVNIGTAQNKEVDLLQGNFLSELGRLDLRYDQQGRVRRISAYATNDNPTFVAGDSLFSIATHIVRDILDYNLADYQLNFVDIKDTLITTEVPGNQQEPMNFSDSSVGNTMVFNWTKKSPNITGPAELSLEVKPIIREAKMSNMADIRYGVSIEEFKALDRYEPEQLSTPNTISNFSLITTFGSLGILVILVFFMGIKYINKGQVEWRRALFILISLTLGVVGWRIFYLMNMMGDFLNQTSEAIFIVNSLIFAAAIGLYGALGYIGWEATARSQNQEQLHLLDAFWQKRFFFRETGEGLLRGYALAGVILGLFAVGLYGIGSEYYQSDSSQFGFTEASMQPKLLTINMSVWINTWLVVLGHVGIVLGFLQSKIGNRWLLYGAGTLLLGFLFAGSGPMLEIIGSEWYDFAIFSIISVIIIYALERSGLLTIATGWWIFAAILLIMPYWGSSSMDVAYVSWAQLFILGIPLIYGFIAFRYGNSVSEMGGYIPEYQERIANHLRVEKEIEIARESQFKLMPLQPPSVQGIDVYGFFMPSFEVGGDYFDYIVSTNGSTSSPILNMTIADVSGKAMKAAMHAVFTSGLLLSRLHRDTPEAILREITPTLYTRTDRQTFITCIIAQYHVYTKKLRVANAGHCLPILKRDGEAEFIYTPEPRYPLGVLNNVTYEPMEIDLQEGDFLLFYSDGLPEAVNPEGARFGFDNLISLVELLDTDSRSSNEISMDIKRRIQKFSDYQLVDDTTIICLKI